MTIRFFIIFPLSVKKLVFPEACFSKTIHQEQRHKNKGHGQYGKAYKAVSRKMIGPALKKIPGGYSRYNTKEDNTDKIFQNYGSVFK